MIEAFIDTPLLKRFKLLKVIYQAPGQTVSQEELLYSMNISLTTLTSMIEIVQDDFEQFDCQEKIQLFFNQRYKCYSLKIHESFSLQFIQLFYLQESLRFKIMEKLLTNELSDMTSTAERFFTTYSTLRRELHYLKEVLQPYGLDITYRKKIRLIGDELHIRGFFTLFCLNSYGGRTWPDSFTPVAEVQAIITSLPEEIFNQKKADKRILLGFFIAVSLLRARHGLTLSESDIKVPLYGPEEVFQTERTKNIIHIYKKHLPLATNSVRILEIKVLFSCVLSFANYEGVQQFPHFFFLDKQLQELNFLDSVFQFMANIKTRLPYELSDQESNRIFYLICLTHYRMLLFHDPRFTNLLLTDNSALPSINIDVTKTEFINQLVMSEIEQPYFKPFEEFKPYLMAHYRNILYYSLDWTAHKSTICVYLISKFSKHKLEALILSVFDSFYDFEVAYELNSQVDVVISDSILVEDPSEYPFASQQIIYVDTPITPSDYHRIAKKFAEIGMRKSQFLLTC